LTVGSLVLLWNRVLLALLRETFRGSFKTQNCNIYYIFRMLSEMYCILDMKSLVVAEQGLGDLIFQFLLIVTK